MTTWLVLSCGVLLIAAAFLILVRIEKGPSMLDRIVALDVLVAIIIAALVIYIAYNDRGDLTPVLVVLALVGFVGSVTLARFVALEPEEEETVKRYFDSLEESDETLASQPEEDRNA